MSKDEVVRVARGDVVPGVDMNGLSKPAKKSYRAARLVAFENQLTTRKAGDAMTAVKNLHDHLLTKAVEGDVILNSVLLKIESVAFREVVQRLEGEQPGDLWDLS